MKPIRDTLSLLGIILTAIYIAMHYSTLPAVIPNHFDPNGHPHRFAPKEILWLLFGLGAAVYVLLLVIPRFSSLYNLPKPLGDPDRPRLEAIAADLIGWIRLEIVLLFACSAWSLVHVAQHHTEGLPGALFFIVILTIFVTTGIYLARMRKPIA